MGIMGTNGAEPGRSAPPPHHLAVPAARKRYNSRDTLNTTGQSRVVFTGAVLLKYFSPLGVPR